MTEVPTPPKPPSPKRAGKGLAGVFKGKPAWMWIAGLTVLAGVAYLSWKRNQESGMAAADDAGDMGVGGVDGVSTLKDYGPIPGGEAGGGYVFAAPTQGAFSGYDSPPFDDLYGQASEAIGPESPEAVTVNIYGTSPETINGGDGIPTGVGIRTGGGAPKRSVAVHGPAHANRAMVERVKARLLAEPGRKTAKAIVKKKAAANHPGGGTKTTVQPAHKTAPPKHYVAPKPKKKRR